MALPKLNDQPKFDLIIPSTKKTERFRPFLVKEEKVLLIALETNDEREMLSAIAETIETCSMGKIDKNTLTSFDIEYLFTQLRGKSVGETIEINAICEHCEGKTEYKLNVDNIIMEGGDVPNMVQLTDDISIELEYPSYQTIKAETNSDQTESEVAFAMMRSCVKAVLTEDSRTEMKDESQADVDAFIDSMNSEQFTKIREYVEGVPTMKHTMNWTCGSCNKDNERILSGIQAFFS